MDYQNLLIEEEDGIILLTFNRPKALNALNKRTMAELEYFFGDDAPYRSGIKGIVLTGSGDKAFVAGADIKEFLELEPGEGADFSKRGNAILFLMERFPKPVIAAVNGFALGGGCEIAMACHLRIAGEKARFGQPEVNLGIIPGYGGTQRLIQYVGKSKAVELMMTGDMLSASEALELGLVNHVVPSGEEVGKAKELIRKISTKGPVAIAKLIKAVNAYFERSVDGFEREAELFGEVTQTADFTEGATAFIEKRAAKFQGN